MVTFFYGSAVYFNWVPSCILSWHRNWKFFLCCFEENFQLAFNCVYNHFFTVPTNAHLCTLKTLKSHIKILKICPPTCFGLFWNLPQGARKLHFAKLLRWDLLIYIHYRIVWFVDSIFLHSEINTTFHKLNLFLSSEEFMKVFAHFGPSQRANISKLFSSVYGERSQKIWLFMNTAG